MKIFKYPLQVEDEQFIELPLLATILTVQAQHDKPVLWVFVDENESGKELRVIRMYATGQLVRDDKNMSYISTFQLLEGGFVGHVFEKHFD